MAKRFPKFQEYVCVGDMVQFYEPSTKLTFRAYLVLDDCRDAPDERQDGFWPTLDPMAAGYIGDKSRRALARQHRRAQEIMDAWRRGEWFYVGVCVRVGKADVQLTGDYSNALWGVEANYPSKHANRYLREVANDLIEDARADALAVLAALAA